MVAFAEITPHILIGTYTHISTMNIHRRNNIKPSDYPHMSRSFYTQLAFEILSNCVLIPSEVKGSCYVDCGKKHELGVGTPHHPSSPVFKVLEILSESQSWRPQTCPRSKSSQIVHPISLLKLTSNQYILSLFIESVWEAVPLESSSELYVVQPIFFPKGVLNIVNW